MKNKFFWNFREKNNIPPHDVILIIKYYIYLVFITAAVRRGFSSPAAVVLLGNGEYEIILVSLVLTHSMDLRTRTC